MFAGAAHAPQVSIIICVEAWVFWIIGWLEPLADLFGYGDLSVMGWLSFATFLAILWNWREGKRKEKGT